jgi:undecaprenyl-diphosphatase
LLLRYPRLFIATLLFGACLFPSATLCADEPSRGVFPPGLLRYELPRDGRRVLGPYLAVGTVLLLTDQQTLRAFPVEPLLDGAGREKAKPAPVYRALSRLGNPQTLGLTIFGLYALGGSSGRETAKVGGVALVNAAALTGVLKVLTGKERPHQSDGAVRYHGPGLRYASFPSGHASATAALAAVLARDHPGQRWLWYGLAGAVGVSRIGVAQHWPSDVWFGWGIGILAAEGALRQRDRMVTWRFSF